MSVLNQMLRDLEARGEPVLTPALHAAAASPPRMAGVIPTVHRPTLRTGRAMLWTFTVFTIVAAVGLWQWREYQLHAAGQTRPPLGFAEFKGALGSSTSTPTTTMAPATITPAAAVAGPDAGSVAGPQGDAIPVESVASESVASTLVAAAPVPARHAPPATARTHAVPMAVNPPRRREPIASLPTATPAPADDALVRRSAASAQDPEIDVARAADLIARGRGTEAAAALQRVLAARPRHVAARRALAALHAEAGQRDAALVTLLEGAAVEPARFAPMAASLQVELGDVTGALVTLSRVPASARTPQHDALTAGVAQRAGQHEVAVDAFRRALNAQAGEAAWWIGLGVSLEALGLRTEAHAAYERAGAMPAMAAELRQFTTQKLSQLASHRKPAGEALVSAQP